MSELHPDVVVVERVFFQTNARTAMSVGQASGVALADSRGAGCEVVEYTSNEVKLAVTGFGAATKDQVQRMVARLLDLDAVPKPADAADALALALCHLSTAPWARASWTAPARSSPQAPTGTGGAAVIASLRGVVTERKAVGDASVELVVDVGGVGYRLVVAPRTAGGLHTGHDAFLAVHTHVREGAITLYGFASAEERTAFELLLGAHGVGPGLALAILSIHEPGELAQVIATGNVDALKLVPESGRRPPPGCSWSCRHASTT